MSQKSAKRILNDIKQYNKSDTCGEESLNGDLKAGETTNKSDFPMKCLIISLCPK